MKVLEYNDVFESYTVGFTVWNVFDDTADQMTCETSNADYKSLTMTKAHQDFMWMDVKYGKPMKPWSCQIRLGNTHGTSCGQWDRTSGFQHFTYQYSKKNYSMNQSERDPKRLMEI